MQVLAPRQLLAGLRQRFEVLGGHRRALPRQQTLRTVIQWSWQTLGPLEQGLLGAAAVCAGGADLDAIANLADHPPGAPAAVAGLARLANLSLISVVHGTAAARYRVLETVSQFVLEKLTDDGRLAALRDRHLAHFMARAAAWGRDWDGPHEARALADADLEHENVSRAIDWALSKGRWPEAVQLTAHLFPWWTARTGAAFGLEQADAALAIVPPHPPDGPAGEALADLYGHAGSQALRRGEVGRARAYAARLVDWASHAGTVSRSLDARILLARCDDREGHTRAARLSLEEVIETARNEALPPVLGRALNVLGLVLWSQDDLDGARTAFAESALLGRRMGLVYDAVVDTLNLAGMALERADGPEARCRLAEVAADRAAADHRYVDQMWLDLVAWLAAVECDWARAVSGFRVADRLAASLHHSRSAHWVGLRARCVLQARQALGDAAFDGAWSQGEAVSLQAALAEADHRLSGGAVP